MILFKSKTTIYTSLKTKTKGKEKKAIQTITEALSTVAILKLSKVVIRH